MLVELHQKQYYMSAVTKHVLGGFSLHENEKDRVKES